MSLTDVVISTVGNDDDDDDDDDDDSCRYNDDDDDDDERVGWHEQTVYDVLTLTRVQIAPANDEHNDWR